MTSETILATIKAACEAVTVLFGWLMTEEGVALTKQMRTDRAAWDKAWVDAGGWFTKMLKGELLK
jgi:hypothetical protein